VIQSLELEKFSVFKSLSIRFSPKINVIVGVNGTGKTHLLKAAYALSFWRSKQAGNTKISKLECGKSFTDILLRIFFPGDHDLKELVNRKSQEASALEIEFSDGIQYRFSFGRRAKAATLDTKHKEMLPNLGPIFLPAKEVLSFLPGIESAGLESSTIQSLFDDSYLTLCQQLLVKDKQIDIDRDPRIGTLLPSITNVIGGLFQVDAKRLRFRPGKYEESTGKRSEKLSKLAKQELSEGESPSLPQLADDVRTEFKANSEGEVPGHIMAEGFKKLGVIQQLLANGVLSPGNAGTLFWDEPESNVNPKLMRLIVETLLDLSRNGQQVILATHDYMLLKWIDLLADSDRGDHVFYHSLHPDGQGMNVTTTDTFDDLTPNAIDDAYGDLTDEEISQSMGDLGKK
jgi:predicted ATPase